MRSQGAARARNSFFGSSFIIRRDFSISKDPKMKALSASIFAAMVMLAGTAHAQVGAGVQVGGVGAGAGTGPGGVGAGAHVGDMGVHVGVTNPFYHHHRRVCRGGWYWHHHHHLCRRW
jgi:hypothetical protein